MQDKEVLLIVYGAIKVLQSDRRGLEPVVKLVEKHLGEAEAVRTKCVKPRENNYEGEDEDENE